MRDFFKGWKRKTGWLALALTTVTWTTCVCLTAYYDGDVVKGVTPQEPQNSGQFETILHQQQELSRRIEADTLELKSELKELGEEINRAEADTQKIREELERIRDRVKRWRIRENNDGA